jgi:hypothetical protein
MKGCAILAFVTAGLSLAAPANAQQPVAGSDLPPAGFGTLNQEQMSVRLVAGDVELRFLPLDERVIRLIAKDGYEALHGVVVARQAQIDSAGRAAAVSNPGLALVSFFALQDDARFDPENVSLFYRNQFYRPTAIVPVTSTFTSRQLPVRQQASAIYLFELTLPVFESFDVAYGSSQTSAWSDILPRIERERVRVLSRWQTVRRDSARQP